MKVKRYLAHDMQEAMIKMKNELGRDAIILHTRKIKKPGIRGFFGKPLIEVVAAIDSSNKKEEKYDNSHNNSLQAVSSFGIKNNYQDLHTQIDTIRNMLDTIMNKFNIDNNHSYDVLVKYEEMLLENNLTKPIVDTILGIVSRQISISNENEQTIKNAIKIIIKDYLGTPYTIEENNKEQKVILFVGPTGVGKTTTLAKLAAKLSIINKKSVGLITADTYRIAAVDQLKTYSEILDIPLTVIYDSSEIKQAVEKYYDKDFILIDTAGRNHKNKQLLNELNKLISYIDSPEVFLLLSLTTSYKDTLSIVNSYDFLKDYKLIFTKLDEATSLGNILNIKIMTSKQLSYITTGQSVPDDIEIVNTEKIASCIVGEYHERPGL